MEEDVGIFYRVACWRVHAPFAVARAQVAHAVLGRRESGDGCEFASRRLHRRRSPSGDRLCERPLGGRRKSAQCNDGRVLLRILVFLVDEAGADRIQIDDSWDVRRIDASRGSRGWIEEISDARSYRARYRFDWRARRRSPACLRACPGTHAEERVQYRYGFL